VSPRLLVSLINITSFLVRVLFAVHALLWLRKISSRKVYKPVITGFIGFIILIWLVLIFYPKSKSSLAFPAMHSADLPMF